MAIINKAYKSMGLPMNIKRGNSWPLDTSSLWYSYDEMKTYAENPTSVSYVGQILALVDEENNSAEAYIIVDSSGKLKPIGAGVLTDEKTLVLNEESGAIGLKDFEKRFYKYIPEVKDESGEILSEANYVLTEVSEDNPWSAGLEPRVVLEDGEFILGWFEQNTTTLDGVNAQISSIQTSLTDLQESVEEVNEKIGIPASDNSESSGIYKELDKKANINDVFTKSETTNQINIAISALDHLQRKIVNSYTDITTFIDEKGAKEAAKYIFMVPDGDLTLDGNIYEEYMVVDGVIEVIGKWTTDLTNYVTTGKLNDTLADYTTKENFNSSINALNVALEGKVDKVDGYGLISDEDLEKLKNLNYTGEENFIKNVSSDFSVDENGLLSLNLNNNSTIINLNNNILELEKAINANANSIEKLHSEQLKMQEAVNKNISDITDLKTQTGKLQEDLNSLSTIVNSNTTNITNLQLELNKYVLKEVYESEIAEIKDILTWKNIFNS